jgi:hypothetical protein
MLADVLEAQRSLIALRQMAAELRADREMRLANLDAAAAQRLPRVPGK